MRCKRKHGREKVTSSYVSLNYYFLIFYVFLCHFFSFRICRHSNITESKVSLWAIGQGPPLSGWRVRRLMRHLYSTEHTAAREVALEVCRKSAGVLLLFFIFL